jgi:hypothetical protein
MSTQDANGIGAQDSRHPAISVPEYTALLTGFQIGIRQRGRSFQLRSGFIKQNSIFEE